MLITGSNGFQNGLYIVCVFIPKNSYIPSQYEQQVKRVEQINNRYGKNHHEKAYASRNRNTELLLAPVSKVVGRKLIYCSRTHSQIKQVVRELRKTKYHPKIMVLGSREQLCVNQNVRNQPSYAQKALCRSLGSMCPYNCDRQGLGSRFYEMSLPYNGLMDIEDLYTFGMKHNKCPYFLSRDEAIMIECQLVLMPYNYLMDPFIRQTLPFDLTECTVIIDEAHNIDSFCLDSMSIDITSKLLNSMQKEVRNLLNKNVGKQEGVLASDKEEEQAERAKIVEQELVLTLSFVQLIEAKLIELLKGKVSSISLDHS